MSVSIKPKKKKKKKMTQEFPGGPEVRMTLLRAWLSIPGWGTKIPGSRAVQLKRGRKKKKMSQVHFPGCSKMWELEGPGSVR